MCLYLVSPSSRQHHGALGLAVVPRRQRVELQGLWREIMFTPLLLFAEKGFHTPKHLTPKSQNRFKARNTILILILLNTKLFKNVQTLRQSG